MGIFNLFKKKKDLVDEIFGTLRYTLFSDSSKNFYDGTVIFDQKEIGITIDADESVQQKTKKNFILNYGKIIQK